MAYALFLDEGPWVVRLRSLVPCALVGLGWWLTYTAQGYGTAGSAWYINPAAEPGEFMRVAAWRAPLLLAWQWLVPADLEWTLSPATARIALLIVFGFLVVVGVVFIPLISRNRCARFWALGMVLSLIPACTAYPACGPDVNGAGGQWVDVGLDKAHVNENLVTAQAWPAHPEWLAKFLEVLGTKIEP